MGSNNHVISLPQAIEMTTRFRNEKENILTTSIRGQKILPVCETFDRDAFDAILAQTDCKKVRIYFCMDSTLKVRLVIVGADGNDKDILPATSDTESGEVIIEEGQRCPDICPPTSSLNS
jgi:hypothetical protein